MIELYIVILKYFTINNVFSDVNQFLSLKMFDLIDQLPIDKNLYRSIVPFIFLVIFLLIYKFHRLKFAIRNKFIKNFTPQYSENKEYQLHIVFLGVIILVLELTFEFFRLRPKSMIFPNGGLSLLLIGIAYTSTKSKFVFYNIKKIFRIVFVLAFLNVCLNLVKLNDDNIPFLSFLLFVYFSYNILKPFRLYCSFILFIFLYLIITPLFEHQLLNNFTVLFNYTIIVVCINYIRHMSIQDLNDKFQFNNQIINKGNSLIMAKNKKNEIVFCSENVESILGYTVEEIMGYGYYNLTENPEETSKESFEYQTKDNIFIRKLKCKNGDFKFIQWKNKHSTNDLIIGIGQDITNEMHIQNQYKNLIQNAHDFIYEIDLDGNITLVNNYTLKTLGYNEEEFVGAHYSKFIRKDYLLKLYRFYINHQENDLEYPLIEVPLLKKNREIVWVAQKVMISYNDFGKTKGYSSIGRDITFIKTIEIEKQNRDAKNKIYNECLKTITAKSYSIDKTLDTKLKVIL
ncbi:MAG: PAS domain-containing protein, partial [Flavobacterium sp.]